MESIKVHLRIRPFSSSESLTERAQMALSPTPGTRASFSQTQEDLFRTIPPNMVTMKAVAGTMGMMTAKSETFTFDFVGGPETQQHDIFASVGKPIVDRCLEGYNGTIFAYGQTGSGKTYTMQGAGSLVDLNNDRRGLIPRCMEYLFSRIPELTATRGGNLQYLCRASYLEIYNENIYDLLDPNTSMRGIREDINRGVFVDGLAEETIADPTDAYRLFERGALNRHVSSTAMNRESSRSHSVLTLIIQSKTTEGDIVDVRESRFNLVDLAGSERQKTAGTTGQRLKEAANINKSLSALGSVINALVDVANGKARHVHYRDSKLTFLLRDSLGGNSVTCIIANVSPATINAAESLGTLKFAQRAKMIKNKAVVNQDTQGNVAQLQAELKKLRQELAILRAANPGSIPTVLSPTEYNARSLVSPGGSDVTSGTLATGNVLSHDDPNEVRRLMHLLQLASRKLRQIEREKSVYAEEILMLHEVSRRKDKKLQSLQMINKLRTAELAEIRSHKKIDEIVDGQRALLQLEVLELQHVIDHHPDVTRFALENLELRDQLERYQELENKSLNGEWTDAYEDDPLVLSDQIADFVSDWASQHPTQFETTEALRDQILHATDDSPSGRGSATEVGNWLTDNSAAGFLQQRVEELQTDARQHAQRIESQQQELLAYETHHQQLTTIHQRILERFKEAMDTIGTEPKADNEEADTHQRRVDMAVTQARTAAYQLISDHPTLSSASQLIPSVSSISPNKAEGDNADNSLLARRRQSWQQLRNSNPPCLQLTRTLLNYLRAVLHAYSWLAERHHHHRPLTATENSLSQARPTRSYTEVHGSANKENSSPNRPTPNDAGNLVPQSLTQSESTVSLASDTPTEVGSTLTRSLPNDSPQSLKPNGMSPDAPCPPPLTAVDIEQAQSLAELIPTGCGINQENERLRQTVEHLLPRLQRLTAQLSCAQDDNQVLLETMETQKSAMW
ncbi:Kinesin-like protein kif15 [Dispira simplex]|nr:Kinesin-like protein kif15 [Dispira simplex]